LHIFRYLNSAHFARENLFMK